MTVYPIEPYVPFLSASITAVCTKMWKLLFSIARKSRVSAEWGDIALWVAHADSAGIRLRLRSTSEDDEDPEWESPPLIATCTEGLCEALSNAQSPSKAKPIKEEFYAWVTAGILKSFKSASVQRLFCQYNDQKKPFSVFLAKHERSFSESNMILLWSNKGGPTPAQVQKRQAVAQRGKRYKAVKKKSPNQLVAEGRMKLPSRKRI
jgi:hypothetical protein